MDAYEQYFKGFYEPNSNNNQNKQNKVHKVYENESSNRVHTQEITKGLDHEVSYINTADGNISNIEELVTILKELCNAAWGQDWGELSLDIKTGENSSKIKLPQILVDINTRDISEGFGPLKPVLIGTQDELDGNNKPTGDCFLLYRQWFDSNIEFDIYGRNSKEARELCSKLEQLIMVYSGYLKRKGLSEIFFLREISPKSSLNFNENVSMRCILYYIRFECITPIRVSTINKINTEIGVNSIHSDKVKTLIENSKKTKTETEIELDFFDGDNGITYQ